MTDRAEQRMKIGLVLPIAENGETRETPGYHTIRDLALGGEAAGFDSLWVVDHLLFRFPDKPTEGIWEGWTLLSALAAVTTRVELGTLVLCTAFRNPALLAKMASTVEEISGGRLILGLGAGWHQPEFDAFGIPFDHKVDRFEEALEIIVPLLREGAVDMQGTYYQAPKCELRPRGPRAGGPPILIGAFKPRMLRLTAQYADAWNTCWLGDVSSLTERRAAVVEACAAAGRDPATIDITAGVAIATPQAVARAKEPLDPAKVLSGTAEQVAASLRAYRDAGVAHVMCAVNPFNAETLGWMADVLHAYHAGAPIAEHR